MRRINILVLFFLLSSFVNPAYSGWWRRRRRCGRVNCVWGGWSQWGGCNHPCGNAGTQSRGRGIATHASCGGGGCSGSSSETRGCNRFCYNGGSPRVAYCQCTEPFWNTCCQSPCTVITNCRLITCTSGSDQQCRECDHTHNHEVLAYRKIAQSGYEDRVCEQVCSWRPDSRFCYPGTCSDSSASCTCDPDYEGTNCLTIKKTPIVTQCMMFGYHAGEITEVSCHPDDDSTVKYTNVEINVLQTSWEKSFQGPDPAIPLPYYIDSFSVGVVDASLDIQVTGASINTLTMSCADSISNDAPSTGAQSCDKNQTLTTAWEHDDRMSMTLSAKSGGYVNVKNYDSGVDNIILQKKYYSGKFIRTTTHFHFDFIAPVHCSAAGGVCGDNMLDRGPPFTKNGYIRISWDGWSDSPAGIEKYEVEVFKLVAVGDNLEQQAVLENLQDLESDQRETSVALTAPGVYSIVIVVFDNAGFGDVHGNHQYARRFLIFDDTYDVTVSTLSSRKMWISSAAANTSHQWVTTLNDKITPEWAYHFANEFHETNNFLHNISPSQLVGNDYEELASYPTTRPLAEIPNIHAIVKFQTSYAVDHIGGDISTPGSDWANVQNVQAEKEDLTITRVDGDSVRVYVKAFDVMGNTAEDNVLVHIDSSPPLIHDVWLTRDGEKQLAVHNSIDLFEMRLEFIAYDHHSGLHEIHWELHDRENPLVVHGSGQITVERTANCVSPACYRIPMEEDGFKRDFLLRPDLDQMAKPHGEHDYDYYFVLTVINKAKLQTVFTYQVTVDTSAPATGVVKDSLPGQADLDFQQSFTIHASWDGFFDKESGVLFYQYALADECLDDVEFSLPTPNALVQRTESTTFSYDVTQPGKYYTTVVAYNTALEPSYAVCSDGVVVDNTPPGLSTVRVEKAFMRPGLVTDNQQDVWFIGRAGCRQKKFNQTCLNSALTVSNVAIYCDDTESINDYDFPNDCEYPQAGNVLFLKSEHQLELSWEGTDSESGIYDYEVGVASKGSDIPDMLPFSSTHTHHHFVTYHANLASGVWFNIHIKAINKAGAETEEVFGPLIIAPDSPTFAEVPTVTNVKAADLRYLKASWSANSYDSQEEEDDVLEQLQFAIGHHEASDDLLSFRPLTRPYNDIAGVCDESDTIPPTCLAVSVSDLDWDLHGSHEYYVSLKLIGVNGFYTLVSSQAYIHEHGPPKAGHVIEVALKDSKGFYDIDQQSNVSTILVKWYGFHHPEETIAYQIGLSDSSTDITNIQFNDVPGGSSEYHLHDLQLQYYKVYYSVIKAVTTDGFITVTSDGITILPNNAAPLGLEVYDGKRCLSGHKSEETSFLEHNCDEDIDYQISTTTYSAFWRIPDNLIRFISHVELSIEEHGRNGIWQSIISYRETGQTHHLYAPSVHLEAGYVYRSSVTLCHADECFQPVFSDGLLIIPSSPRSGKILHSEIHNKTLSFSWERFADPFLPDRSDIIEKYEWTIIIRHGVDNTEQLFNWMNVSWDEINGNKTSAELQYEVELENQLEASSCLLIAVRGYNKVGLSSVSTGELHGCTVTSKHQLVVVDAVGELDVDNGQTSDINLEENAHWFIADQEYTPSSSKLSAVWPSLRYPSYKWKVISDDSIQRWAYVKYKHAPVISYHDYTCSSPEVVACGQTELNYINVPDLPMHEGQRFYICIYSNGTDIDFEKFDQHLPEVDECSNGIVVDIGPPTQGHVYIGSEDHHSHYQVERDSLFVHWDKFTDAETYETTSHESAIMKYELAIGSSEGGVDVQDFTRTAYSKSSLVQNILLQDGQTYFASIKATDYVGWVTTSYSEGVTIDSTPPVITGSIDVNGGYITTSDHVQASWSGVFIDRESGIAEYMWCVGSHPGHCDITDYIVTVNDEDSTNSEKSLSLRNGHHYFITVQAINGAGLSTLTTSSAFTVDTTPPTAGFVADGKHGGDIDYQTSISILEAQWTGFEDFDSDILSYTVCAGSCDGCEDVIECFNTGLEQDYSFDYLTLSSGSRYYTTVTACNRAELCVTVSSDGVIPDDSPPTTGRLFDGFTDQHIMYQSSTTQLAIHWHGFHDVHSGISHIEWKAGTTPGGDDVLQSTHVHKANHASTILDTSLTPGQKVFSTVTVWNLAGMNSTKSSDGFIVDDTAPSFQMNVEHDPREGSIIQNSQVVKTTLAVRWTAVDDDSHIKDQYLSIMTSDTEHLHIPTFKVEGHVGNYIFTNLSLSDGHSYQVKVTACNPARLCTTSISPDIKVDNSPPTPGAFAVETVHSAMLERHRDSWMTYDGASINLIWVGFSDPHSSIKTHYVIVGKTFDAEDLLDSPFTISHTVTDPHEDEGYLQKATINLKENVLDHQKLYITIWVENHVGLLSSKLLGLLEAIPSGGGEGTLDLIRRCDEETCEGHCSCAPQDHLCTESTICQNVTGDPQYASVTVYDMVNYRPGERHDQDTDVSRSQCVLGGAWEVDQSQGLFSPQRYYWTVGVEGDAIGSELFDQAKQIVWQGPTHETWAIFTTSMSMVPDLQLQPHTAYVFYVKAWYDDEHFATFVSDGVIVDGLAPELSSSRKIKETRNSTTIEDVDFITSTSTVYIMWNNVFRDAHADIMSYSVNVEAFVGKSLAVQDFVHPTTRTTFSSLNLEPGIQYYTTVEACNTAGLCTTATSDGFMVDTTEPVPGVVWDGAGLSDVDFTSQIERVILSWHGFSDAESYIDHYVICAGSSPNVQDILPCQNVGSTLFVDIPLSQPLSSGSTVYGSVRAVDAAGLTSRTVTTDGVKIDTSQPLPVHQFQFGNNLLTNPSFEDEQTGWTVGVGVSFLDEKATVDGVKYAQLTDGKISQEVITAVNERYRVTLYAAVPEAQHSTATGEVILPGVHKRITVSRSVKHDSLEWTKHILFFTAAETSSLLEIGTVSKVGILLVDMIEVRHLGRGNRTISDDNDPQTDHRSPLHVHITTVGIYTTVTSSWDVEDPESPIVDYTWAVGTVRGGVQLLNFGSVGRAQHAHLESVQIAHGSSVFVTVVVTNAAGVKTVIYSDPHVVDLTPPQLCCVKDGLGNEDIDYQVSTILSASWSVLDKESGVKICEWAIGFTAGSQEVQYFTETHNMSYSSVDIAGQFVHGQMVYVTVRCVNYAGLLSILSSDGVVMTPDPPITNNAYVDVIINPVSHFPPRNNHQVQDDTVIFGWNQFHHPTLIPYYETKLTTHNDVDIQSWQQIGTDGEVFCQLTNLHLLNTPNYHVNLRAVDQLNRKSSALSDAFVIDSHEPHVTGNKLTYSWPKEWILSLDWTDVFVANSTLIYEISLGSASGGADLIQWKETASSKIEVTTVFDHSKQYFVHITAITESGLYTTQTFPVAYIPPT